ncbi:hypothetical protein BT96DRAFT_464324 [Gymnopus androsaceus JB14]|uniref:Uncharacterized protein n=1 Tax=Gymnopus androsaceus JB14 TaxID=1447944 RepID=A0A6A4IHN3_9AGAR|nr:hypothetical protein BT96DRAFT_464324 [Gymnopus androsaceus JB14]
MKPSAMFGILTSGIVTGSHEFLPEVQIDITDDNVGIPRYSVAVIGVTVQIYQDFEGAGINASSLSSIVLSFFGHRVYEEFSLAQLESTYRRYVLLASVRTSLQLSH